MKNKRDIQEKETNQFVQNGEPKTSTFRITSTFQKCTVWIIFPTYWLYYIQLKSILLVNMRSVIHGWPIIQVCAVWVNEIHVRINSTQKRHLIVVALIKIRRQLFSFYSQRWTKRCHYFSNINQDIDMIAKKFSIIILMTYLRFQSILFSFGRSCGVWSNLISWWFSDLTLFLAKEAEMFNILLLLRSWMAFSAALKWKLKLVN